MQPIVIVGGDYQEPDVVGGNWPKRVRITIEGEFTRWNGNGSTGHPHTRNVEGYFLIHEDGRVTCDLDSLG